MSALRDEIIAMIEQEGPITLERYMSIALAHPTLGYYMTRDPFGAGGDFITAPEISQMFGELLGLWAQEAWRAAGSPSPVQLIELGPGRGTLMSDVLRVARIAPSFLFSSEVHLVETSPVLEAAQRRTLAEATNVSWSADIAAIPPGPAIILANEFFDALPVRHYVRTARGWSERLLGLDDAGALAFGVGEAIEPGLTVDAPEGSIIEIGAVGARLMSEIAARLVAHGGAMLVIDYGYTQTALGESLQAVARHAYVDPLEAPGEADLTAHVDFAALARAATAAGARVQGPVTQGAFLTNLGVVQRAEALQKRATPEQAADIAAALQRLTGADDHKRDMGELFKVMAVTHPAMPELPGFVQ
ncbi:MULTISPECIES: class I SAM-dependent methyltransferase [Methylosinus]|uniref:Methyltransferase n=1 Tax=Methylosinus trichosporium (strain ATCC 35070 / NCIMB 11131 / UNIQEM 75 / OB3b) TaxID=595536 RepID=A0A2D2D0M1_METT3|nr:MULTISPECIES: SAM-dependent methyltransferase [Methylosinus]ATQ68551.1 methyltransferase [Methylosinus trichosporium OB3b]OBS52795.1 methyltransferase [Methylosinus sp. 3S-1]